MIKPEHGKVYKIQHIHTGEIREGRYHFVLSSITWPYFFWPVDKENFERVDSWVEGYDCEIIGEK